LQKYRGFEFLEPLVSEMIREDPATRPSMDEVVARFDKIRAKLGDWKLRGRLVKKQEDGLVAFAKDVRHVFRTIKFIARRYPAVPTPCS